MALLVNTFSLDKADNWPYACCMDASEYKKALRTLGLTQEGAAELVGSDKRTGRRWASGERAIPPPMETLIRLLLKRPELIAVIRDE